MIIFQILRQRKQEISLDIRHLEKSGVMMGFALKILRMIYVTPQWKFQIS